MSPFSSTRQTQPFTNRGARPRPTTPLNSIRRSQPFAGPGPGRSPRMSHQARAGTLFAVSFAIIAAILWWVIGHAETPCGEACPASGHVAFLIDLTDPLDPAQTQQIVNRIRHERDHLRTGKRLTIFVLHPQTGDQVPLQILFSAIKPSDGTDTSRISGNPEMVAARYRQDFIEPSEAALGKLREPWQATPESPLIEALHWLALDAPGFDAGTEDRSLILVSDLLQNSKFSSRFKQGTPFATMAKTNSAYLSPNALAGVRIEIIQTVNRHQKRQTRGVRTFWEEYFTYAGTSISLMKQL